MAQLNVMVKDFENEGDNGPLDTDDLEREIESYLAAQGFDHGSVVADVDG